MKSLLREPLLHFLVLGGLLFGFFAWKGGSPGPLSTRIAVTPGHVQNLAAGFTKTWQRPPTERELKALIDEYVKEEIATREAAAMGLDRDDTVIRRRLRQKLEFLAEDASDAAPPPTDAEIAAWVRAHPDAFGGETRLAFRQVFLRAGRRGAGVRADAEKLLARLRAAGPGAAIDGLGDATMLPGEMALGPVREVERSFGKEFAERLAAAPAGVWAGPLESSYGLHLVLVSQRVAAEAPSLVTVRPLVERELAFERQKKQLQELYDRLLAKYSVAVEMPKSAPGQIAGTR